MTKEEILSNLCYYDKRNPDGASDDEIEIHNDNLLRQSKRLGSNVGCSCENCFYGRHRLANELLRYISNEEFYGVYSSEHELKSVHKTKEGCDNKRYELEQETDLWFYTDTLIVGD